MKQQTEDIIRSLFMQLHRCPELGHQEYKTTEAVRSVLTAHGVEILPSTEEVGLTAVIRGKKPGPVIGLRADMDALPIEEETDLPYKSEIPGKMHACGHDFHTASMVGAALLLREKADELPGTVKVVFQPAEEPSDGAVIIQASGVLDDVSLMLAGHTYPGFEKGTLGIREGAVMAAVDFFTVTLHGRGSHAAQPHKSLDPVPAAGELILALQTIVSRKLDPFSHSLVTVGHVQAGTTRNVIPEKAILEGTARTLDPRDREKLKTEFYRLVNGIAAAHGLTAEIEWIVGPDAVINDARLCQVGREVAAEMGLKAERQEDTLGGEDFSMLAPDKPHLFVRVGTGGGYINHHPKFTADQDALPPAAEYFARLAEVCLERAESLGI